MGRRRTLLQALAAGLAFLCVGGAGVAQAAPVTSLTIFSDPSDFVGKGAPFVYDTANGDQIVAQQGTPADVKVVGGSLPVPSWSLEFAGPDGHALAPGVYDDTQRAPFQEPGHPGLDVGANSGCNTSGGRFEVKDIAFDASGAIQRLWIVFEQHCGPVTAALFGELRIGIDAPATAAVAESAIVRWSADELERPRPVVPVVLRAAAPLQVASASVGGPDAADFQVAGDECSGVSVAAGASCRLLVRFAPSVPGTRTATLNVADSAGGTVAVALQGWSYGGATRVLLDSDPGDFIGQGGQYAFTPANSDIVAYAQPVPSAQPPGVRFVVTLPDHNTWTADFNTATGAVGVDGPGRSCGPAGTFTVTDATSRPDGSLRTFGAKVDQHCVGAAPGLRGEFDFRVGDTTPPAPWMAGGTTAVAGAAPATPGRSAPLAGSVRIAGACGASRFRNARLRSGTARRDMLTGGPRADVLLGKAGNDVLRGARGGDCLQGGAGADHLSGGSGNDVLDGGPGRDVLNCGPGRDVAHATRGDRVHGCERVLRAR